MHRRSELNSAERKLGFDPRNLIWIIPAKGVTNDAIDAARAGICTPEMKAVAAKEYKTPEEIRDAVAKGIIAIPANINHTTLDPKG